MGDPRYSYMKPAKKEEKKKPANKGSMILPIIVSIMAAVNLIVLVLSIITKESGNKLLFWSVATALWIAVDVVIIVCRDN